jgi:hypothetical protein
MTDEHPVTCNDAVSGNIALCTGAPVSGDLDLMLLPAAEDTRALFSLAEKARLHPGTT